MNDYFVNITKTIDIPEFTTEKLPIEVECIDPIDEIIYAYKKHPSILKISETVKPDDRFSFANVTHTQIEKEMMELNSKRATGADGIPPKIIKNSFMVLTLPTNKIIQYLS